MNDDYPRDWNQRRKLVYKRDNYQCQNCGRQGGRRGNAELHAHHIVPKSKGGSHQTSNLTTVCQHCHSQIHGRTIGGTNRRTTSSTSTGTSYTGSNYGFNAILIWWAFLLLASFTLLLTNSLQLFKMISQLSLIIPLLYYLYAKSV